MRPLLSQFQAPAASRKACRFFRAWLLSGLRRPADHPAYFGLAIFVYANPFSRRRKLRYKCYQMESMPVFGATVEEIVEIAAQVAECWRGTTFSRKKDMGMARGPRRSEAEGGRLRNDNCFRSRLARVSYGCRGRKHRIPQSSAAGSTARAAGGRFSQRGAAGRLA